jgi:hypothetical protein
MLSISIINPIFSESSGKFLAYTFRMKTDTVFGLIYVCAALEYSAVKKLL